MAFDPFCRAWGSYERGGIEALEQIEAPLYVSDVNSGLAEQVAHNNPGLEPGFLRWMILPDATPMSRIHLIVAGGRGVQYDEATDVERHVLDTLTHATSSHIKSIFKTMHGTGVFRFGMQVPTMHAHVVGREVPEDGLDWTIPRTLIPIEERRLMRKIVAFNTASEENSRGLSVRELDRRVAGALLRFA